jgi:DNA-binding transcriptional LysR family regulator
LIAAINPVYDEPMHFGGLDLRHLRALDALLHEAHVSRAAARISVTQPAVSNSLARLREHFRDDLLVRVGSRLALTPFAASIKPQVRRVLLDLGSLAEARPTFDPESSERSFSIMMTDHFAGIFLPQIVKLCTSEAPGVQLSYLPVNGQTRAQFAEGEIDIAVLPISILAPEHPRMRLLSERWVGIARSGHPVLRGNPTRRQWRELAKISPLIPGRAAPQVPAAAMNISVPLIPLVVSQTDLVAMAPESFAAFHAGSDGV